MSPIHPGEVLLEEYMRPLDISVTGLARTLGVPEDIIQQIVLSRRAVTVVIANLLGSHFDTSPLFWLNLQAFYEQALAG